ncbi:MAG: hypothetical protein ACXACG_02860 [Candidatus Thorarchaeota archaeon]
MKREEGGIIAIIFTIIVIVAIVLVGPWSGGLTPWYNPGESLPHLPAPGEIPSEQVEPVVMGNLTLSATGGFYTMRPHQGPATFSLNLYILVNNTGSTAVDDFQAVKVTLFYENATPVYTFGTEPEGNSTIPSGSILNLEYKNDRDMIDLPSDLFDTWQVFARVLVTFDGNIEVILTTPMTSMGHAIE